MQDSKALASIPVIPANTAPPAPEYPWPKPYTSAMFLSFEVDAESAWTSKDATHAQRLITMSYGGYEARVGTPKLLELLDQLDLKATFFVTGWSVDAHPAMAEAILKAGHEIGHHGYHHLLPDPGDPWMHGLSARFSPRPIFPKEHVLSIWKDELDEVRDWGAMVTTVLHPQCSGRPMRLRLLREFLTYAKSCPDLWITTGEAIAANFIRHEAATL